MLGHVGGVVSLGGDGGEVEVERDIEEECLAVGAGEVVEEMEVGVAEHN